MNKATLLLLGSLFTTNLVLGAENENWSVKSTERQFDNKSEVIFTTSNDPQTNTTTIAPSSQSKSATQTKSVKPAAKRLTTRPVPKSMDHEFWVFDAWVDFHGDDDADGYIDHFSVEFDVDTVFSSVRVYAVLYLGVDEVFKEYHTTSNFSVFSDTSNDSFVVESELLTGFAPADYEVLIEVYDAHSDELVAVYDGNDDADLYLLPLESIDFAPTQVVVIQEHGGSLSLWALLLFPVLLVQRFLRQR